MDRKDAINKVLGELQDTLTRKGADYGNDIFSSPRLCPHIKPFEAILTRLSEKWSRLETLLGKNKEPQVKDESAIDTMRDIAGYIVLALSILEKEKIENEITGY